MYFFSITSHEEVSPAVRRIISEQYDLIIESCNSYGDINKSVHDIRKASKRVRALLRMIKPDIHPEVYTREKGFMREISHKLSVARNFHVFEEEFNDIVSAGIVHLNDDTKNSLKQHLKEKKEDAFEIITGVDMFDIISKKTEEAKQRIAKTDLSLLGPHTVYKGIGKVFSWGQKQMMHSQQLPTDENLHEMRKRIKTLMYLVKLIRDVSPQFFNGYFKGLKAASLALGDDHNMAELSDYIDSLDESIISAEDKSILKSYIDMQRQQIQLDVWPEIAKLYTGQAGEFSKRVKAYWLLGRQG
ncbi:MAG: CHAD domain-containing protein [Chlorobi bacterium]|nr:CHAD domain-containing protein [Chlorobiota bacterium]